MIREAYYGLGKGNTYLHLQKRSESYNRRARPRFQDH